MKKEYFIYILFSITVVIAYYNVVTMMITLNKPLDYLLGGILLAIATFGLHVLTIDLIDTKEWYDSRKKNEKL